MMSEAFRNEKLGILTDEYEQTVVDLRETQERLRDEWEDRRFCHRRADSLEINLEEARAACTLAYVNRFWMKVFQMKVFLDEFFFMSIWMRMCLTK